MIDGNQEPVVESVLGAAIFGGITTLLTTGPTMTKMTAEEKAAKAEAKAAERAAAKEAKLAAAAAEKEAKARAAAELKAAKLAEQAAEKARKTAEREAARAEKAAARTDAKSMAALADKASTYVKGLNGQLNSGDDVATVLGTVPAGRVVSLLLMVLGLDENPYSRLNYGQQSMNLRNRFRGAYRKDPSILDTLRSVIAESDLALKPKSDADPLAVAE